jgi:hypothetical protein
MLEFFLLLGLVALFCASDYLASPANLENFPHGGIQKVLAESENQI